MDYFAYPLDTKLLLRKKNSIKKELLQRDVNWIEKRVAVLGGSTTNEVVDQIELALLNAGIKAVFYQSDYGRYWEDGMFGNETLNSFMPDIIYIYTSWRNIQEFPKPDYTVERSNELLVKEYERYSGLWKNLKDRFSCPIIQNNFDRPNYRLLGNRDIWDHRGRSNFISKLNQKFYEFAQGHTSFYINDLDYLAQDFGLSGWNDSVYWNMYKYICPLQAVPYIAKSVADIIKSIFGKNKKLLALDLDNTLWGGVVGDDGVEGIKIGREMPQGQVYYEFQKYCQELKQIGVVLAVDSKNDESNALDGLSHPDGVLKPDDFVAIKANWNPKDQNLREIANELALGLDSFVFVDDNPAEREIVKKQIPEVSVLEMDKVENFIKAIDHSGYFEVTAISKEDMDKTEQYRARAEIKTAQEAFSNYEEYLKSLKMEAVITEFEPINIQRVTQLTNKSNQFNLTTLRCSEDDICKMQADTNFICLCGRLIDKFADNGIVTVVAAEKIGSDLHIRLWLMSCRVLKRGMEDLMMNVLMKQAKEHGVSQVYGYYYPTKKNNMVKKFYQDMGFSLEKEDDMHNTVWKADVDSYAERNVAIDMHA